MKLDVVRMTSKPVNKAWVARQAKLDLERLTYLRNTNSVSLSNNAPVARKRPSLQNESSSSSDDSDEEPAPKVARESNAAIIIDDEKVSAYRSNTN